MLSKFLSKFFLSHSPFSIHSFSFISLFLLFVYFSFLSIFSLILFFSYLPLFLLLPFILFLPSYITSLIVKCCFLVARLSPRWLQTMRFVCPHELSFKRPRNSKHMEWLWTHPQNIGSLSE
jgi:hypothetical protein